MRLLREVLKGHCNLKHPGKGNTTVSAAAAGPNDASTPPSTHCFV
jgi:hypothetical protein